ncbi:hypothetical protein [Paenibacillus sp. MMS20-IR301]|uniref:hypothetical protein n=1 Tax=Paenibacillus sp. MMS20-IR301 TaxID=2895946 RepID=UPI0028E84A7C|nr:hypothetical protein [Paenibacillus sp. MMS20-IR301]WNS45811.1 hypothetical protein LOS79_11235 [Paenibacillus sp. MMS20-IR301]
MTLTAVRAGVAGICLLLVTAGCSAGSREPEYTHIRSMSGLDGGLDTQDNRVSPVMLDVYDRSIPEEVYSVQ